MSNATGDETGKEFSGLTGKIINKHDDANVSNDDIIVDDGKSTEGMGERNNPFDMHIYTHRVDNEEAPG